MPFVKDKSYKNMPFSNETPMNQYQTYLSVAELMEKVRQNPGSGCRCRALGIVTSIFGAHILSEIDNNNAQIRLSLAPLSHKPPLSVTSYAAQVFGYLIWENNVGPVLYAHVIKQLPAVIALRLQDTLRWVLDTHYAFIEEERDD